MPLVERTPMALEIDGSKLINRVGRGLVWPFIGRSSHPLDDNQSFMKAAHPLISFDQQSLVALKLLPVEDVRTRKLTVANGEGTVQGRYYNLKEHYGIGLRAV
jgi:hypothetical protein